MQKEEKRDLLHRREHRSPAPNFSDELTSYCRSINDQTTPEATEKTLVDAIFRTVETDFVAYMGLSQRHDAVNFYTARGCLALGQETFPVADLRRLLQIAPEDERVAGPMSRVLSGSDLDQLVFLGESDRFAQAMVLILPAPGEQVSLLFVGFRAARVHTEGTLEFLDAMLHVADVARRKDASHQRFKSEHERVSRAKREWQCSVDVLNQLICLVDRSGRVVRANRAVEQLGLGKVTDVHGSLIWDLLMQLDEPTDDGGHAGSAISDWCSQVRENWAVHWESALNGGVEWVVRSASGEPLYGIAINLVDMSTRYSEGVETHAVLVVDDISKSPVRIERFRDDGVASSALVERQENTVDRPDRLEEILSDELINAQEEERSRVAIELHDGIGQMLTMMKLQCDCVLEDLNNSRVLCDPASRIKMLRKSLADAIDEVRRVSMNLRPPMLDDLGIAPTLRWFFRECQKSNPTFELSASIEIDEDILNPELETEIFRITQESINNIAKHAGATSVKYMLRAKGDEVSLTIEDDGVGFETSELTANGAGLRNMLTRVARSGGQFSLDAAQGEGVKICVDWQLGRQSV